jgi:CRP-like cAMP-binding protein
VPSADPADGDFLRRLTDSEAKSLEARSRRKSFARGAIIFRDGDPGDEALVLRSGRVKVSSRRRSREVILAVLDPGSLLGEVSAIDGGPRSATVVALEPVEVDVTSFADFREFLEEHPRVASELLRFVVRRLRDASLRQVEFGTVDTLGRLCVSLTQLADRYGHRNGDHVEVDAPINQQELAEWAGMSREAVVKGLRQLRSLGWLTVDGRALTLLDPQAIRRRAGQR